MPNPWEQDWGGNTATESAPWEQSWSDSPTASEPAQPVAQLHEYKPPGLASRALEATREFLAPVLGPTEQMRLRDSVKWTDANGNETYVYKPLGDKVAQEGLAGALSHPMVALPKFKHERTDNKVESVSKAAANVALGFVEFFESPMGLATMGATAGAQVMSQLPKVISGAFAADLGTKLPEAVGNTRQVLNDPAASFGDKAESVLGTGTQAVLVGTLAKHTVAKAKPVNAEARAIEQELATETQRAQSKPWEVDFQSGLNEAPATGTASPVERFIYEQKARQEAAAKTQDSTPEPMPWEMEYAGGEMPSESGKGLEAKVLSLESTTRATRPTTQDSVPAETLSPAAQEMPAPTLTAPSRAVETTQAASAAAAGVKLTTETQRAQSVPAKTQKLKKAKQVETPVVAVAKVQEHVTDVASGAKPTAPKAQDSGLKTLPATGTRPAKEIKTELVQRLEKAIEDAPFETVQSAKDVLGRPGKAPLKITIDIPGDGVFTIFNAKETIREVLAKAKKLDTTSGKSPAKLPSNRAVDTATGAKQVYGERPAIQKLREQADNPNLEMEASVRQELRDAADWLESRLPENVAAKKLETWRADLANALERNNKAAAELQKLQAEKAELRKQITQRIESKKPFAALNARERAVVRKIDSVRVEVNQSAETARRSQERVIAEEQIIAAAKAGKPVPISSAEAWADKQLKGGGMKFGSGPDPAQATRFAAAVAIKGSYVIARGVRDFAAWSAEMIRQLPELAQASAEQLKALYARAVDIAEGRDPEIGLSVRGMKVKADTSLSDEVRQNTEAAYAKRVSADDVAEAKRLVQAAGGPEAAARDMLSGLWKPVADTVQVKGAGEILAGLAALERRANDIATQERLADLQVRIAEHSTAMATRPAQWLQAFASLYGNYTPAAWLKEWRKGVDAAAKTRIERATGKPTGNTAPEMAQDIAGAVAEGVRADAPTTAAVIESVYGGKGKPGETATQAVERIIGAKGEKAQRVAKKIQDFYEKEVNKFKKKHKIPELSPEDQRTVLAEAKAIERLPADSLQRREAVLKLLDSLHRRKGFEWWELPVSFWYANVLSGPTTHAKNILGNSVNLGMEAGLQSLLKPTNIPVILESLGRSLSVGAKEAWSILQTGHDTAARHGDKFELRRNPLELQSGGLDKVLLPWKLVGRLLRAEDAVFFNAGQELRAAILARRAAGGDTAAMRQAMGWTPEARAKAEAQATAEGLTGLNLQRRVNEIIEQGRSNEVMNAAREFGYDVTFNNEPYGVLGAFTNKINEMFHAAPILKPFVLPFTRIVANVFNSSVNWTPVGTYRALRAQRKLGWLGRAENSGKLYGREINDPLAIRDAHARALVGTAAIIAVAAAAIKNVFDEEPEFMVTGSGPANKEQRDALRASGWIPYSVKIGGRYYSYADKPPQIALSIVGHYLDAIRYKNLAREDALNRVTYALNGSFNVILQSSWMQGLNSIFGQANRESIKNPQRGLVDQITKTGSGFVVPSLLKQADQFFDPQKYSPQDVQGMLIAQVPFARRTGQPDLNAFGQPVYSPTSKIFWSKPEGDMLVQKLAGARVFPGTPNQGDLTEQEHYALVKFRGPILREMLAERADEWVGAPRLIAQDIVNSISSSATEKAKAELGLDEANKERREFRKVTTK